MRRIFTIILALMLMSSTALAGTLQPGIGGGLGIGAWPRTPLHSDIFFMDAEVFDIDRMYTDFIERVQFIVPEVIFTDISEDISGMLDEDGWPMFEGGTRAVSFLCNGNYYKFELENYGDWLNTEIVTCLNDVLALEGCDGRLHIVSDEYDQMLQVFYGSDEEAAVHREANAR